MDKAPTIYEEYYRITEELIKTHGPYTILLYQVGAFYEVYAEPNPSTSQLEKSQIVEFARICQLNISNDKTEQLTNKKTTHVMAGFRDYCLDKYLEILMANGMTTVVYNQKKEGKKITREFYKTFSPGTYISYDTEQSPRMNNQIMCIWLDTYKTQQRTNTQIVYGLANTDIYTGESNIFEHETQYIVNPTTFDELERRVSTVQPSEIILISALSNEETRDAIQYAGIKTSHIHVILLEDLKDPNVEKAKKCAKQVYIHEMITTTYGDESYQICQEFQQYTYATQAFCYLLHFMQERNPDLLHKIAFPTFINSANRMILANHTLSQLNIIDTEQGKGTYSSVASFLNKCNSPMGRRAFKRQITQPTFDRQWLNQEYEMIQVLLDCPEEIIPPLRKHISQIRDLEKISRQIVHDKMYPSSIATLYTSIQKIRHIAILIQDLPTTFHQYLTKTNIEDISIGLLDFIDKTILVEKCRNTNGAIDENIFCKGVSKTLDNFVKELDENQAKLSQIHSTLSNLLRTSQDCSPDNTSFVKIHETEKSGISLLITKTRAQKLRTILANMPIIQITANFQINTKDIKFANSKQASSEEITIPILSEIVKNIAHLKESLKMETQKCFTTFIQSLAEKYTKIDDLIKYVAKIDVIQTKAHIAKEYNYCRPVIQDDEEKASVRVKAIRHVLIEHIQQNEIYVTNDLELDDKTRGILLYGTNAVGKTSFIRAIGIAIIMAQSGMYVPAQEFIYSPYKAIFSRILGNDNLFKGLSTFAVEMSELRVILKEADEYSLILGDELCSGTETESALSIFTAGLRFLYDKNTTFLFATHFHEILRYDEIRALEKMRVMHMAVHYDREKDALIYTRKLQDGPGNRMYGLEVCQSLYLPPEFLDEAYRIRNTYFPDTSQNQSLSSPQTKYNAKKVRGKCEMCNDAMGEEIHHLSPQKDAQSNGFIGHFHKNHPANLVNICEKCHLKMHREEEIVVKKKTTGGYKMGI